MLGKMVFKAYYGTFQEYYSTPKKAILFFTSATNNVDSVKVLNEPILDWEVSKAGSITFSLPPCNAGYSAIKCKQKTVFIERNGKLVWHGRAISESFSDTLNREIVCEGALNLLLDTHIKPLDVIHYSTYKNLFNNLIDCHNRALSAGSSVIFSRDSWKKMETNGTIRMSDIEIMLSATNMVAGELGVWSNPSMWRYTDHVGKRIRVSFIATKIGSGNCSLTYGMHLRPSAWFESTSNVIFNNAPSVTESKEVSFSTYLGPGGLDGTGHENYYIGFHAYLSADANVAIQITDLRVEFYLDYREDSEKAFPFNLGSRTGIQRIPFGDTSGAKVIDISDYPTTLDAINSIFIDVYGGYLYVGYEQRYEDESFYPVLNYIYGNANKDGVGDDIPELRYGKNITSFKETTNYENFPTVLIPLGRMKEEWEKAVPAPNVTYLSGKYIDKDGVVQSSSNTTYYVAELPVIEDDIYYIYGKGVDDQGLYSIVDGSGNIIESQTFSNREGDWYQHKEIQIPNKASKLRIFFVNTSGSSSITSSIFAVEKYIYEDYEDYLTLEGYVGNRTDDLAGSKYIPTKDIVNIYDNGWTEQVVHFEDANTKSELWSMAAFYLVFLQEAAKTYEAEAVELAPIVDGSNYAPIGMPGSYAKVVVPKLGIKKKLCVTRCSINLRNFSKSTYSLANLPPPDLSDLVAKGLYL